MRELVCAYRKCYLVRMRLKSATYKKPKMEASLVSGLECNNVTLRRKRLDGIFAHHTSAVRLCRLPLPFFKSTNSIFQNLAPAEKCNYPTGKSEDDWQ